MNTLSSLSLLTQPVAWLLGSVSATIATTNLVWLVVRRWRLRGNTAWRITAWLGNALFWIILPLLAWQTGALSPYYLGLSGLDWVPTLMTGAPVVALVTAVLLGGWLAYRRTLPQTGRAGGRSQEEIVAAVRSPLDAALRQWHWAFYRATAIAWTATWLPAGPPLSRLLGIDAADAPLYWGSWLGLLFVAAEWALNPFARAALRTPEAQVTATRQAVLAIATTALFALTRNLWLCLICHMVVETVIAGWLAHPAGPHGAPPMHTDP